MVFLHGQSEILGKLWFEATSPEIRGWIRVYIFFKWQAEHFFLDSQFLPMKIFQRLEPQKSCRKNTSTSGNCRESKVLPKWSLLQIWLKARCGVFSVVLGMLGYADVPNVCKKGSEVSSSFGIAFYSVPDVTLKFLRIFLCQPFFWPFLCFVEGSLTLSIKG